MAWLAIEVVPVEMILERRKGFKVLLKIAQETEIVVDRLFDMSTTTVDGGERQAAAKTGEVDGVVFWFHDNEGLCDLSARYSYQVGLLALARPEMGLLLLQDVQHL